MNKPAVILFSVIIIIMAAAMAINCSRSAESAGSSGSAKSTGAIKFYVGSSDGKQEHSIFLCELRPESGEFSLLDSFAGAKVPNYLAFSPGGEYLYAISDEISDQVNNYHSVTSFRINRGNHKLERLNSQSSQGVGPCHVYCSKKGTYLFVANYTGGSVAAFPLSPEGNILPASSVMQSEGTGPVANRQEGPHTHYVSLDRKENFLLSPDLGSDRVLIYKFDHNTGILSPNPSQPFLNMPPGAGPRHLVFNEAGSFIYVVSELNSTVTACRYNEENGTLTRLNSISTVSESHEGTKYPAAIRIHPDGNYIYASTRGDRSSIAVFQLGDNGEFNRIQVMENVPEWPRDFNIDPSGHYLLAAGERSDEIRLYKLDPNSGRLTKTGHSLMINAPGCILFID